MGMGMGHRQALEEAAGAHGAVQTSGVNSEQFKGSPGAWG
jgi:hypothetical protein